VRLCVAWVRSCWNRLVFLLKLNFILILDIPMFHSNSKNKIIITSNTSMFIVDRSRQHVSTLKGSSSGLLFETSL